MLLKEIKYHSSLGEKRIWSLWWWFLKEEHKPRTFNFADLLARTQCTAKESSQEERWKERSWEDLAAFLLAPDSTLPLPISPWNGMNSVGKGGHHSAEQPASYCTYRHTSVMKVWRSLRESQAGSPPSATGPPWLTFLRYCPLAGLGSRASCASGDRSNKHRGPAVAFMLWPRSAISSNAISCR